ncbi:hypothetical protein E2C01_059136 [Portunus trituberculatus]|uniref:Uncharacterized protein n=1 Tax=Portunus trituberculatus TaxID=210409 RepID=A0A5B7H895_PORTR|nr:hypothetical protein [Portunus trituberculatus]
MSTCRKPEGLVQHPTLNQTSSSMHTQTPRGTTRVMATPRSKRG